jgi:hypothetical protein
MADGENVGERLDRELIELLNGLRVILPGVQVLFAFLLGVPFTQVFGEASDEQRAAYFAAFTSTAAASILLIAPSSYHRLRWRQRDKERLLRTSNRLAISGVALLGVAVTATVYLVSDALFGAAASGAVAGAVGGGLVWFWYGLPLLRRLSDGRGAARSVLELDAGRR